MKIVFFGSTHIALPVLNTLDEHHAVVAVVTTPDAIATRKKILLPTPIAQRAGELGIPVHKFVSLKAAETIPALKALGADLFVVGSYGKIIPSAVLDTPRLGNINVHPSLLPQYRGPSPIPTALRNGDTNTGTTLILMDAEMDHGPILAQEKIVIDPADTFTTLATKLWELSAKLLINLLPQFEAGTAIAQVQDHDKATYTQLLTKEDGKIEWSRSGREIYNQYRAYIEWPGIWTTWNGQALKILECSPIATTLDAAAGTVLGNAIVKAGDGTAIAIQRLQMAGKNPVTTKEFLNGNKSFIGSLLGT